ncbi:MAG: AarF/UbiB family protein [Candidatus Omnitrophica bacterium]|nr:AarF/UbiB family protein [Candidatus Omnitrophota bacterium]
MFLFKLKDELNDIKRLREIAKVFTKYGLGYLIQKFHLHRFASKHLPPEELFNEPLSVRVRKILEELGPTFIKLGQMLSLHPDIVPPEFCKEFEKLQDAVPAVEFEKIKEVIEKEFNKPLNEVFKDFPSTPIASASLAQVYKVSLGNKEAIVKVQKPYVEKIIRADLEILEFLANHIDKHYKEARVFNPKGLLAEFKRYMLNELNFSNEIVNIETFRHNFRHDKTIHFPLVYEKLCTNKVIVIEHINGIKLSNIQKIRDSGLDTQKIAHTVIACILKQIFIDGFFHGDPHPGNLFILPDGKLSFVDFGVVGRIDDDTKFAFAHLFTAAASKDVELMMKVLQDSGGINYYTNEIRLKFSLQQLLDKYYGITLEELNMNDFLRDLTRLLYENKVRIPPDNFILIKSLGMLESEAKMLDPGLDFGLEIKSISERIIKDEYSVARIMKKIGSVTTDIFGLVQNFPKDLFLILNELKRGELKIGFEHLNLEPLISMLDKVSNRISFSLIIASLIIGSSLLVQTNTVTPLGSTYSLGTVGFMVAAAFGFWLVVSIMRSGKL